MSTATATVAATVTAAVTATLPVTVTAICTVTIIATVTDSYGSNSYSASYRYTVTATSTVRPPGEEAVSETAAEVKSVAEKVKVHCAEQF